MEIQTLGISRRDRIPTAGEKHLNDILKKDEKLKLQWFGHVARQTALR